MPELNPAVALGRLQPNGPYDLLRSFARVVCAVVATRHPDLGARAETLDGGEFRMALRIGGAPLLVALHQEASGAIAPCLLVGQLTPHRSEALMTELGRVLCLDHDLSAFYRQVAGDRPMAELTRRYHGLRLVLSPTIFEGLVHAIVFQQVSYAAARTVEHRLVERWGDRLAYEGRAYLVFPPPERVAALSELELRSVGIPPRKAKAILQVAREAVGGMLDLDALARLTDADGVARRLEQIPGIGDWTAHHVTIRGMGLTDCLPLEDPGLRRAVAALYGLASPASGQQVREVAERWRPWRSYGTYYLWNTFWEPGWPTWRTSTSPSVR